MAFIKTHAALLAISTLTVFNTMGSNARAEHPQILTTNAQLPSIQKKIATAPWAKAGFAALKAEVDPLLARTASDPQFVTSRMLMYWDTHYTTTLVKNAATVGAEGSASVPTPRFEGARDWNSPYVLPSKIEDWRPHNDNGGQIYLLNRSTHKMEWADPGKTGGVIRSGHERIMELAADAAFIYWVTGDEKYAKFSSDILRTFMDGFSVTTPPKFVVPDKGKEQIIGSTTFEVIHEGVAHSAAICYDFIEPYLVKTGQDTSTIQNGLRRWAERDTVGGLNGGNWNLHQAMVIGLAGLALEPDSAYGDRKGRDYYTNIVLNAELPAQTGLTKVLKVGFDPVSALWPEAAGYGFGAAGQVIELASLMGSTPEGTRILEAPFLMRSIVNQSELLYPNGLSEGVGDTTNVRMSNESLENLLAAATARKDTSSVNVLASYLGREIAAGHYDRSAGADIWALARFVPDIPSVTSAPPSSRSFWFPGLNIFMQRNLAPGADPTHSLAAAMYGSNGWHVHQNGLAIELYGAGYIQGADPGRGSSYWAPNHREYYITTVAHNTVVVNGVSSYNEAQDPNRSMTLLAAEPASEQIALSPDIAFAQAAFTYDKPAAKQMRTLALIRTGAASGFYYDVFRSAAASPDNEFNDYIYHNMGTLAEVSPALSPSSVLAARAGMLRAYSYLKNERSAATDGDIKASFLLDLPGKPGMNLWMPAAPNRMLFALDAPGNNAIRDGIDRNVRDKPMPTLIVRQTGEAWLRPFVAVYEPVQAGEATIQTVRTAKDDESASSLTATVVQGSHYRVRLFSDDTAAADHRVEGVRFRGLFGAVIERDDHVDELYMGSGINLQAGGISIQSASGGPCSACLRRNGKSWLYSASAPVTIVVPGMGSVRLAAAKDAPVAVGH